MKHFKNAALLAVLTAGSLSLGTTAGAQNFAGAPNRVLRATQMGAADWAQLQGGTLEHVLIEFRQGDELPLRFVAEGDLIETKNTGASSIVIKRSFWVRPARTTLELSLDGTHFANANDVVTGRLEVGSAAEQNGGPATGIQILLTAFLKR